VKTSASWSWEGMKWTLWLPEATCSRTKFNENNDKNTKIMQKKYKKERKRNEKLLL
jgi:hypothetical protein